MKNKTILIADDDLDDQFLLRTAFEEIKHNCTLDFVEDGEQLKKHLEKMQESDKLPNLILMDLNMPKIDGRTMLNVIKNTASMSHIPVLIISTSTAEAEIKNAYSNGASAYIVKPAEYSSLTDLLRNLLAFYFDSAKLPNAGHP